MLGHFEGGVTLPAVFSDASATLAGDGEPLVRRRRQRQPLPRGNDARIAGTMLSVDIAVPGYTPAVLRRDVQRAQ